MSEAIVLLVESNSASSSSLAPALSKANYKITLATTGAEALAVVAKQQPEIVVVDATSMRSSGVRICQRLRKVLIDKPLIHCRRADQREDRRAEADVYLVQPFTARKLLNRMRALIPADDFEEQIVRAGQLTFYLAKRSVEVHGHGERQMTPKLADLLEEFLRHPNEVLGRHWLMENVWDTSYFGDTRTLDVHIRWLREIIEVNPAKPEIITTLRGLGYVFSIPADAS